jgi:hypothetical protein
MPILESPRAQELVCPGVTIMDEQPTHWSERAKTGFVPPIGAGLPSKRSPHRSLRSKILVIGAAVVCVAAIAGALLLVMNSGKGTASAPLAPSVAAGDVSGELRAVLDRQCRYLDESDIDGYLSTIDEASPAYATSRIVAQQTLAALKDDKLDYTVETFQLLTVNGTEATARAEIVTAKVSGSTPFVDNRVTAVHSFKKSGGKWLLSGSKIESIQYLQ